MTATRTLRRQPTEAQKAAAAERREQFRRLVRKIAAMADHERDALAARMLTLCTCEGHALSRANRCLIAMQMPSATMVGGFQQWRKHGRKVRKGERGLSIWIPIKRKAAEADAGQGDASELAADAENVGFLVGHVWDVSQTEPMSADE